MIEKFYRLNEDHSVSLIEGPHAMLRWAECFESLDRVVAKTNIEGVEVSTVFLGLDHSFGRGPPLLFETMTFDDYGSGEICLRYSTWDEAVRGHNATVVELLSPALKKQLADLAALPDDAIDTSDIPEVTDWSSSQRGRFAKGGTDASSPNPPAPSRRPPRRRD
jgi:hypothetical protein